MGRSSRIRREWRGRWGREPDGGGEPREEGNECESRDAVRVMIDHGRGEGGTQRGGWGGKGTGRDAKRERDDQIRWGGRGGEGRVLSIHPSIQPASQGREDPPETPAENRRVRIPVTGWGVGQRRRLLPR